MFEDPLIDWNLRNLDRILSAFFLFGILSLIGFIGRKSRIVLSLVVITTCLLFFLLAITRNKYGLSFFSLKLRS